MFLRINEIEINLGLKKQYKVIHFSDTHLCLFDEIDTKEEKEYALKMEEAWYKVRVDFANHFKEEYDRNLLSSKECFDKLIAYSDQENPNCLLLSGDIIDYYSRTNYKYLEEKLNCLSYKYLFCCGNHETPLELFDTICKDEIEYKEDEEIILVSLDNSKKKFTNKQITILKELIDKNKPIIISMHIPIITKYNCESMDIFDDYFAIRYNDADNSTKQFIDLLVYSNNVKAVFCGHTHGMNVTNFGLNKPQYIASSGLIGYVNKITIV